MILTLLLMVLLSMGFSFYLFILIHIEKKRNRILQSFVAGIIRSISTYYNQLDAIDRIDISESFEKKFPIEYSKFLENVDEQFCRDFWMEPYMKWVVRDRNIFTDEKYNNGGFTMMYWDFHDRAVAQFQRGNEKEKQKAEGRD